MKSAAKPALSARAPDSGRRSDEGAWRALAALLGWRGPRGVARAGALLDEGGLVELAERDGPELEAVLGLTPRAAERLAAAFQLARCWEAARRPVRPSLRSPEAVFGLLRTRLRGLPRETFFVLLLDGRHRLRRVVRTSEGTLSSSLVHPREVFGPAVRESAAAVICAHNHPSGDPEPSREDLDVTRRLLEAGRLLGIPLLDHVVVGDGGFVSLRERMGFRPA